MHFQPAAITEGDEAMSYETERETVYREPPPVVNQRVVDERRVVTNGPAPVQQEQIVTQAYVPAQDTAYSERVVEDESTNRFAAQDTARRVVWFLAGLLLVDLALRFVFKLTGANAGSGFASFVYGSTNPFVAPFNGIFGNAASGGAVFEPSTIVAMIVYALLAWGITALLGILLGGPSRGVREYRRDSRSVR